jgi:hypothetical protein
MFYRQGKEIRMEWLLILLLWSMRKVNREKYWHRKMMMLRSGNSSGKEI